MNEKQSDEEPSEELTEAEKEEHLSQHDALHGKITSLLDETMKEGNLTVWCLMQELLAMAAIIELDNDADREGFLRRCGDAFDLIADGGGPQEVPWQN